MPLWHCSKCHHEWEGSSDFDICDWCDAPGYVLEETTPLEMMMDHINELIDRLFKMRK